MPQDWLDLVTELIRVADERADVDYVEVVKGDLSIRFGRDGAAASRDTLVPAASAPSARVRPAQLSAAASDAPTEAPAAAGSVEEVAGTSLVRSPMVGTFYRASAPGKPPFVELGAAVTAESTMGLVEAMKVFTSIHPDVAGTVEAIFCGDGEFIEFDQPLFRVRTA